MLIVDTFLTVVDDLSSITVKASFRKLAVNDQRPEFLLNPRQATEIVASYRISKPLYGAPRKKRDDKKEN